MVDLVCVIRFNELPLSLALSLIHYAIAGVRPYFGVGLSAYEVSRAEVVRWKVSVPMPGLCLLPHVEIARGLMTQIHELALSTHELLTVAELEQ